VKNTALLFSLIMLALSSVGCRTGEVPQAFKGQMFDMTGPLAVYAGGDGFVGPILGPGSYWTGIYDDVRLVECSTATVKEEMTALTKDGVQFGLDVYVRYNADCGDVSVFHLLKTMSPDKGNIVSGALVYSTFIRPVLGEAVRETVSPHRANDVNDQREDILARARKRFMEKVAKFAPSVVTVHDVALSNLDFPNEMDTANVERAVQGVLKDKAIAERDRVDAETQTMVMRKDLAKKEGEVEAAKIDEIGAALRRNPDYLQFDMQKKMPEIYKEAGANGNMVIAAPSPQMILQPKTSAGPTPAK
jgi:regulator of protease activity HflC (stomatin/prohibitin superfamily)